MTTALPEGCTWRRPGAAEDEAPAVFALVAACNEAVIGIADWTLDDAVEQLGEPGFDAERGAWLVHDGAGALVGFGCLRPEGAGQVGAEVFATDDRVRGALTLSGLIPLGGPLSLALRYDGLLLSAAQSGGAVDASAHFFTAAVAGAW